MNLSVNLAGNIPPWNDDVNLRDTTTRAVEVASQAVVDSVLADLETASGAATTGTSGTDRNGTPEHVLAQTQAQDLPALPAEPVTARAVRGTNSFGIPVEDWFESSLSTKDASGTDIMESAGLAKSGLTGLSPEVVAASMARSLSDEGIGTRAITSERQLNLYGVDSQTVPIQPSATETAAAAVIAKATQEWRHPEWPGIRQADKLMKEIPLLIAPVPVEPQLAPERMRFKTVVISGMLMLGAVLAAILVTTLNLKDLPMIQMMKLAAAALAIIGTLYLILRWARPHRA